VYLNGKMHGRLRHSYAANKPLCLSSTALQPWPEKARRVGVAITNANINLNIKLHGPCGLIKWATKCAKYGDETEI